MQIFEIMVEVVVLHFEQLMRVFVRKFQMKYEHDALIYIFVWSPVYRSFFF